MIGSGFVRGSIMALLAAVVLSCSAGLEVGSGGGGGGGIGGSGIFAQGTITGFGSIFVNGVEFDTGRAAIEVDDEVGAESDLKLGMVVAVSGSAAQGGRPASAATVTYSDQVKGPVLAPPLRDADDETLTLDVLGVAVRADRAGTVFDGTGFDFDNVAVDDVLRVSGLSGAGGVLRATRIEKLGVLSFGSTRVKRSGVVNAPGPGGFLLGALTVSTDADTRFPRGQPVAGDRVEVKGVLLSATEVLASMVRPEAGSMPADADADAVELEGLVSGFDSIADFVVAEVRVDASAAQLKPAGLVLGNGARVEVEGRMRSGVLLAQEVKGRGGEVRLQAFVARASTENRELTLVLAPGDGVGSSVAVSVDAATAFDDKRDRNPSFALADIDAGDLLKVRGYQSADRVIATEIRRIRESGNVKLKIQARVEASSFDGLLGSGTVTLLGAVFVVDASTTLEDADDDAVASTADFFAALVDGVTILKLDDRRVEPTLAGDGIADSLEFEKDEVGGD